MNEIILNIDNKEILTEVLHLSIDFMIGLCKDDTFLVKSTHKYGFSNSENFGSAIKFISNLYKEFCLENLNDTELISYFAHMNQDQQQTVLDVVKARKNEIEAYLLREFNSKENKLMESFDWDVRLIMGHSGLSSYRSKIATLILNCTEGNNKKSTINFEMNKTMLDKFIEVVKDCDEKLNSAKENKE